MTMSIHGYARTQNDRIKEFAPLWGKWLVRVSISSKWLLIMFDLDQRVSKMHRVFLVIPNLKIRIFDSNK